MRTKGISLLLITGFLLVLTFSFAIALNNNNNSNSNNSNSSNHNKAYEKPLPHPNNFGQCTVNATKNKNECYKSSQKKYKDCNIEVKNFSKFSKANNQTFNNTQISQMKKACSLNIKQEMETCRNNFKDNRALCNQFKCKENQAFVKNKCVLKTQN
jgi:hypothetical protein